MDRQAETNRQITDPAANSGADVSHLSLQKSFCISAVI